MKISVILPCFNGAKTIAQQLEALCSQSWDGGWEVIVSNNGSTDNSMEIVERYRHCLPELKVVQAYDPSGPRKGVSHSYNTGMSAASGDAFVFCESDDEVGKGWLQAMGNALLQHEFVAARLEYSKLNPEWILAPEGLNAQETEIAKLQTFPHFQFAWGCTFGWRRSLYEKLGGFDTSWNYACDSEYCFRAQLAGFEVHLVPEAVIHYRLRHSTRAVFDQQRKWGKEFKLLMMCHQIPAGKFAIAKGSVNVVLIALKGIMVFPLKWLRVSNSHRDLYFWAKELGWEMGLVNGLRCYKGKHQKN